MKTIGLVSQKGGAGKSTAAVALASALAAKHRVILVDLDPQGSVSRWASMAKLPATLQVVHLAKATDLKKAQLDADFVVIDTKGELSADALPFLDLALIPCSPSIFDLWAAEPTVALAKAHQSVRKDFKAVIFATRVKDGTVLGADVLEEIRTFDLPAMQVHLTDKIGYPMSIATGANPVSSGNSGIRLEALRFAKAVEDLL